MNCDELLSLLDDPKVQQKILSLIANNLVDQSHALASPQMVELEQNNSQFENSNPSLKRENEEMVGIISRIKESLCGRDAKIETQTNKLSQNSSQITDLERSVQIINEQLENSIKQVETLKQQLVDSEEKAQCYQDDFSEDMTVKAIYSGLSAQTKGSLSGIFKSTTPNGLIACGIQEKNIGNLWDYAKNEVVNDTNPDIVQLIKLFDILFSRFILAFPMYQSQTVIIGDEFDTQLHIKHSSSSNVSGPIAALLLCGYLNSKTGKVIKQSIVKV